MAGLLDFLNTPQGQGLLSGVASYAMNARRGQPVNSIGRGLAGGILGYQGAQDQIRQQGEDDFTKQLRMLQMSKMQQDMEATSRAQAAAAKKQELFSSLAPKYSKPTYSPFEADDPFNQGPSAFGEIYGGQDNGSVMPTQNLTQTGSTLDFNALQQAMPAELAKAGYIDEAMAMQPKNEPYTLAPGAKRFIGDKAIAENPSADRLDPNKPFLVVDGKIVPNPDYQKYEIEKARAGASRVTAIAGGANKSPWGDPPKGTVWGRTGDGAFMSQVDPATGAKTPVAIPIPGSQEARSPAQNELDKKFGQEYAEFVAAGGAADVAKQLEQLREVRDALAVDDTLTGPIRGQLPDSVRSITNPQAIAMKNAVEEVVQRNLRIVLGAQFTEKEGERLIARAYNPVLPAEENLKRVNRLITQVEGMAAAKVDAAQHFEKFGTLQGWKGKLPSMSDIKLDDDRKPARRSTDKPLSMPKKGDVKDGYIFKGGDPANPLNWKKQ